jgi:hypothetical protein
MADTRQKGGGRGRWKAEFRKGWRNGSPLETRWEEGKRKAVAKLSDVQNAESAIGEWMKLNEFFEIERRPAQLGNRSSLDCA